MPKQHDELEPTEADIDMVLEDATGKPVKDENLAASIASMRQLIVSLEAGKTKLLDRMDATADSAANLNQHLVSLNQDLATTRERLAYFEAQIGRQN